MLIDPNSRKIIGLLELDLTSPDLRLIPEAREVGRMKTFLQPKAQECSGGNRDTGSRDENAALSVAKSGRLVTFMM